MKPEIIDIETGAGFVPCQEEIIFSKLVQIDHLLRSMTGVDVYHAYTTERCTHGIQSVLPHFIEVAGEEGNETVLDAHKLLILNALLTIWKGDSNGKI